MGRAKEEMMRREELQHVGWAEYNEAQRLPSRENSSLFF